MNLTPQQLQFINTYLKNSGVQYDDIRYEMTDHVASALENRDGEFDDNFKQYMLNHKKELLDNNKIFRKIALNNAIGILHNNLIRPLFWGTALVVFTIWIMVNYLFGEDVAGYFTMALRILSTLFYGYFWYYKVFSGSNNSVIDKLVTIVYFVAIIFRPDLFFHFKDAAVSEIFNAFAIAFFVVLMQSLYKLNKQYQLRYGA